MIVIVGISTRALAESAVRAGYQCSTVDAFGDLDQRTRVPNRALTRDCSQRYSAAAAVALARGIAARAAAYTANLENHPAAVRRLARGRELLGNTPETLALARDPWAVAEVARRSGAHFPLTLRRDEASAADCGRTWIRKPLRGGGGSGVDVWNPGLPLGPRDIVQQRVDGVVASALFVADGRRAILLGLTEQIIGDPAFGARGFRYCGNVFPLGGSATESVLQRCTALAGAATEAWGLRGVNGIDFVLHDGEIWVLETNPRPTAAMELVERSCGISIFDLHVHGCRGELPAGKAITQPATTWAKAILFARRPAMMGDTDHWLQREDVRDVPFPGDRMGRGRPVCTIFASAPDRNHCYATLVGRARALQREIDGADPSVQP